MLEFSQEVKQFLQRIGIFPVARAVYRRFNPHHQKDIEANRKFFSEFVSSNDLCFDIGANVGQTTEALIAAGAKVIAVEPNPNCAPVLQYEFGKNDKVTIVRKAIGSTPGTAELNFTGTESTASIRSDWPFASDSRLQVDLTTLDHLIEAYGRPKLIKVDVEGFELEVFKGLTVPVSLIYFEMHSSEFDVLVNILERLAKIGTIIEVRVVSGDNSKWLIDEWVKPNEIIARLGNPPPRRGNVIVKMKVE